MGRYWDKSEHDVRALSLPPLHIDTSTKSLPQSGNKLEVHFKLTATCSTYNNISKEYNPEVENSRKLQLMPKCNDHGSSLVTLCIFAVLCVKATGLKGSGIVL